MKLFFDTETTGFKDPRLVQLAAILTDDEGKELERIDYIIKPDGFEIPERATQIHGITTVHALEVGIDIGCALTELNRLMQKANELIAHNIAFDLSVLGNEISKNTNFIGLFTPLPFLFCTMVRLANICNIPGRPGRYKLPTLQEAYRFAFGHNFENAHNAMADVQACSKLYFWRSKQIILEKLH